MNATRSVLRLAALTALLLIAGRPAQARTETVLHNFTNGSDGGSPVSSLIFDSAGNLYGVTQGGGTSGQGTVFELSPNGSGAWNETTLYNFCSQPNCTDGGAWNSEHPSTLLFDSLGNLYGTTPGGGAYGYGVVYELSPAEGGGWTETVLHSFTGGADGANPTSGVIMDPAGNLYATTRWNGTGASVGTVLELSPSSDGWTEQVIYAENYIAVAGLTMDAYGNIFAPAFNNYLEQSFVLELSPNGSGGWNSAVIYTFPCNRKGKCPKGSYPNSPLVILYNENFDAEFLYGTTLDGGSKNYGTTFDLVSLSKGPWTMEVAHSFTGGPKDGSYPVGLVWSSVGSIFGTTSQGGKYNDGTIFELVGGTYKKDLWSFEASEGSSPSGAPILDRAGNIYGNTASGGSNFYGVTFEVTP